MRTYMLNPKCLFIICNIIVVFLIGESKLVASKASPVTEIYNEYVNRSVSLHKLPTLGEKQDKGIKMDVFENGYNVKKVNELNNEEYEGEKGGGEDLPAEELHKRVEDFIARVNKQRRLEARSLLCTNE
ncbi:hypothetical protein IFM89_031099 [Coptis chinensis]|uniref:DUF4408 domain-containing protein n=1 Tax=Coptis chinensis TaxID=261450 RepID=A0A835IRA8_9MAGN|nr:hypothetical protein IFM89_031099 [Coptis chinensis]